MRYEVVGLSEGWTGTDQTVAKAMEMVQASLTDPVVINLAHDIVRHVPERDTLAEHHAISAYVRSHVRYTKESIETLKTPRWMIDEIRRHGKACGDCDDHVILWAALHRAVGFKVRMAVVSQRRDRQANHIFAEVFIPGRGWVSDDTIVKWKPIDWRIPPAELTKEKRYTTMGNRINRRFPTIAPYDDWGMGRTQCVSVADFLQVGGGGGYMRAKYETPSSYRIKTGGMMEARENGTVGFIAPLISLIAPIIGASAQKKLAKAQAKASAPPPPPVQAPVLQPPPKPRPPAKKDNTLVYVGLAAGAALLAVIAFRR